MRGIRKTFEGVEDVNGFGILKNKWFQILDFFVTESSSRFFGFTKLVNILIDL